MKIYRYRKGFTVAEIIIVILVIAVLAGISVSAYTNGLNNANIRQTVLSMQYLTEKLTDFPPHENLDSAEDIEDFLYDFSDMTGLHFRAETISVKTDGFTVLTDRYNDGFNQPFKLYFSKSIDKVMCISSGKNTAFESEDAYADGSFDDDIVMLLKFKEEV